MIATIVDEFDFFNGWSFFHAVFIGTVSQNLDNVPMLYMEAIMVKQGKKPSISFVMRGSAVRVCLGAGIPTHLITHDAFSTD